MQRRKKQFLSKILLYHNRKKSLQTTRMASLSLMNAYLVRASNEKIRNAFCIFKKARAARALLLIMAKLSVNSLLRSGLKNFKSLHEEITKAERKADRWKEKVRLMRLKSKIFSEIKIGWTKEKNLNKLGEVFSKMQTQMNSKKILSSWLKYTFRNEKSLFNKEVKSREWHRLKLKKKAFLSFKLPFEENKMHGKLLMDLDLKERTRLLRASFKGLLNMYLSSQHQKKFEGLNKAFKAWKDYVQKVVEERQLEQYLKEEEKSSQQNQNKGVIKQKKKTDRFMALILGNNTFENRLRDVNEGTEKVATEFSSEDVDMVGEDKAIKSAF